MQHMIFAAGCFWGVQFYLDQIPGVTSTVAGYTGGHTVDPTYEQVCAHGTGHAEAVLVEFDPAVVGLESLYKHFFRLHEPTQLNRQGPDVGDQYRSAIFYFTNEQKEFAERIIAGQQEQYSQPIVTSVELAGSFYPAEDYHQKYAERSGRGACHVAYEPLA